MDYVTSAGVQRCLSYRRSGCDVVRGPETSELATQRVWCGGTWRYQRLSGVVRGYSEVTATQRVFVREYIDVGTSDAAGGCAGYKDRLY